MRRRHSRRRHLERLGLRPPVQGVGCSHSIMHMRPDEGVLRCSWCGRRVELPRERVR